MAGPIISQDGNWLWNGDVWVPISENKNYSNVQQTTNPFDELYLLSKNAVLVFDYQLALKHLIQMKEMGETNQDPLQIHWAEVLLGNISIAFEGDAILSHLTEFETKAHQAVHLAKKHNNLQMEIDAKSLLGGMQGKTRNWNIALQYQLDRLHLSDKLGEIDEIAYAHLDLSMTYMMLQKFDEAKSHLALANNSLEALSSIPIIMITSLQTIKLGFLMKENNKAFANLPPSIQSEIMEIGNQCISILNDNKIPNLGVNNFILEIEKLFEIGEPLVQNTLQDPHSVSFDRWSEKFATTDLGNNFVPISGLVYKKITQINFRLYSPIVPANLQPFHQKFVNELASHGIGFLEIGPKNPQLMNEQGSLLSKQLVDGNGYEWRYFEDSSTFYWDGVTWIEGIPEPEKKKKTAQKNVSVPKKQKENSINVFVLIGQIIGGILMALVTIFNVANNLQSGNFAGQSNQSNNYNSNQATYQCLCGNIEHSSRWMGSRKCSRCGKNMYHK
jgi:hypothetical protein